MQRVFRRVLELAAVFLTRPAEFVDRVESLVDRWTDSTAKPTTPPQPAETVWKLVHSELGLDAAAILNEPALAATDALLADRIRAMPVDGPFVVRQLAEKMLGHVAYVICRARHPETVVETGVCYGSMTTYVLSALDANGRGMLHSVDLPSIMDRKARFVGHFVPERLKRRWSLHLGASRRVLPRVLKEVKSVDVFIHDSLHTRRNMSREFATVTPYLAARAVVLSDDVDDNPAFETWARDAASTWAPVKQVERGGSLGIAFVP